MVSLLVDESGIGIVDYKLNSHSRSLLPTQTAVYIQVEGLGTVSLDSLGFKWQKRVNVPMESGLSAVKIVNRDLGFA